MKPLYAPVVLVVDDDPNVLHRLQRGVLQDSSLGVLTAGDLTSAARFLADRSLKIDALLTDLGFVMNESASGSDLLDGLDLVEYAARNRPEIPIWIFSALADDSAHLSRARERVLPIQGWFVKFGGPLPWTAIEPKCWFRALMGNLIGSEGGSSMLDLAMKTGIDLRSVEADAALVRDIRQAFHPTRWTYLTTLPAPFSPVKPIVVLIKEDEDGMHQASAPELGLIAHAQGANAEEAVEHLSGLIVEETEFLLKQDRTLSGYAAYVREKLAAAVTLISAA